MSTQSPTDAIAAKLADGGYGDFWNYAVRADAVDAVWAEPDALARLEAIVVDDQAPMPARFLACEVLFEKQFTFVKDVGPERVAEIYARALADNLTGRANSWGLLYEHDDAGPTGIRFEMIGKASVAPLRRLLADDRRSLSYEGSEAATVGNGYQFRVKDFAAYYLSRITGVPFAYHPEAADRDRAIDALAKAIE